MWNLLHALKQRTWRPSRQRSWLMSLPKPTSDNRGMGLGDHPERFQCRGRFIELEGAWELQVWLCQQGGGERASRIGDR
jgi:hypothetical protein